MSPRHAARPSGSEGPFLYAKTCQQIMSGLTYGANPFVFVAGAPGMGKSTLLRHLQRSMPDDLELISAEDTAEGRGAVIEGLERCMTDGAERPVLAIDNIHRVFEPSIDERLKTLISRSRSSRSDKPRGLILTSRIPTEGMSAWAHVEHRPRAGDLAMNAIKDSVAFASFERFELTPWLAANWTKSNDKAIASWLKASATDGADTARSKSRGSKETHKAKEQETLQWLLDETGHHPTLLHAALDAHNGLPPHRDELDDDDLDSLLVQYRPTIVRALAWLMAFDVDGEIMANIEAGAFRERRPKHAALLTLSGLVRPDQDKGLLSTNDRCATLPVRVSKDFISGCAEDARRSLASGARPSPVLTRRITLTPSEGPKGVLTLWSSDGTSHSETIPSSEWPVLRVLAQHANEWVTTSRIRDALPDVAPSDERGVIFVRNAVDGLRRRFARLGFADALPRSASKGLGYCLVAQDFDLGAVPKVDD